MRSLSYSNCHIPVILFIFLGNMVDMALFEPFTLNVVNNAAGLRIPSAREFGRSMMDCLASAMKLHCMQTQVMRGLEAAIKDNGTWHFTDFLTIEKDLNRNANKSLSYTGFIRRSRQNSGARDGGGGGGTATFSDRLGEKLLELAEERVLRLELPQPIVGLGISDTLDDVHAHAQSGLGQVTLLAGGGSAGGGGGNSGVIVHVLSGEEEGRKKKDKDKHMASYGGMAMMAMVAQMFLGKVILIAGAAFVMAKIALLVSVLGSLKKGSTGSGSSGGSTDHVIVTSAGGGHHDSGWHRSMPPYELPKLEQTQTHDAPPPPPTGPHHSHEGPPHSSSSSQQYFQPSSSYYMLETTSDGDGGEGGDADGDDNDVFKRRQTPGGGFL